MDVLLTLVVCGAFVAIAAWHADMALRPGRRLASAVPSLEGRPLFVPSRGATLTVAAVLLLFALLVAATGGLVAARLPQAALAGLSYGLALGLVARAVGEFRYVGFFKRVRGTRFARLDTLVYSPLCLLLAGGVALVASRSRAP